MGRGHPPPSGSTEGGVIWFHLENVCMLGWRGRGDGRAGLKPAPTGLRDFVPRRGRDYKGADRSSLPEVLLGAKPMCSGASVLRLNSAGWNPAETATPWPSTKSRSCPPPDGARWCQPPGKGLGPRWPSGRPGGNRCGRRAKSRRRAGPDKRQGPDPPQRDGGSVQVAHEGKAFPVHAPNVGHGQRAQVHLAVVEGHAHDLALIADRAGADGEPTSRRPRNGKLLPAAGAVVGGDRHQRPPAAGRPAWCSCALDTRVPVFSLADSHCHQVGEGHGAEFAGDRHRALQAPAGRPRHYRRRPTRDQRGRGRIRAVDTLTLPARRRHLHLRDGAAMAAVVGMEPRPFRPRARHAQPAAAGDHRGRRPRLPGSGCSPPLPPGPRFEPLMTLYLTPTHAGGGGRPRPAGELRGGGGQALTRRGDHQLGSRGGTDLERVYPVLEAMAEQGLPLAVHGEVTDPAVDVFDARRPSSTGPAAALVGRFPGLKVVLEHVSTPRRRRSGARRPADRGPTVTAHHLLLTATTLLAGGIRPHHYCLPVVLKGGDHRRALLEAVAGGRPRFFLGTDSAPTPPRQGVRRRRGRHLHRPRRPRAVRRSVRGGGRARPARGLRFPPRRRLLPASPRARSG